MLHSRVRNKKGNVIDKFQNKSYSEPFNIHRPSPSQRTINISNISGIDFWSLILHTDKLD